ncbi:hypothetical protein ACTWP6_04810 [Mycobacterium sp. 4D054]|uniref:hypothetical protein n=1 Tax=Mycobacterium sp. 4D054 TaxID=3457440 RepID=UPI003FD26A14
MPSRQDSRARVEEASRLRASGRTWDEIATAVGYRSRQGAQQAVERLRKRNPLASAESQRRTASEGLRIVRAVLFEEFASAKQRGDSDSLVAYAKEIRQNISEDAKLHGAYAPVRSQLDVNVRQDASAIIAEARDRLLSVVDAEVIEIPTRKEIAG